MFHVRFDIDGYKIDTHLYDLIGGEIFPFKPPFSNPSSRISGVYKSDFFYIISHAHTQLYTHDLQAWVLAFL